MAELPKPRSQVQYEALKAVGFVQRVDKLVAFFLVFSWLAVLSINWMCRLGILSLAPFNLLTHLQVCIFVTLLWLVVLVFRCTYFVIQLMARVNLMPYEAARILEAARGTSTLPPIPGAGSASR